MPTWILDQTGKALWSLGQTVGSAAGSEIWLARALLPHVADSIRND